MKRIGLHEYRHSYVIYLIEAGVNLKAIAVYAGHRFVAFTLDRYGYLVPTSLDDRARLGEVIGAYDPEPSPRFPVMAIRGQGPATAGERRT